MHSCPIYGKEYEMAYIEKLKSGRFRVAVSCQDNTGTKKRKTRTFDKESQAKKWGAEMEAAKYNGFDFIQNDVLFIDYFDTWVNITKKATLRIGSLQKYRAYSRALKLLLPKHKMSQLNHLILQNAVNEYGKTHAQATTKGFTVTLKAALKDAMIDKVASIDLYSRLKANSTKQRAVLRQKHLNREDFEKLNEWLFSHRPEIYADQVLMMTLISLQTGMRLGEVLGLTRSDIDLTNNIIDINKSYSTNDKVIGPTKTKSSVRVVAITKELSSTIRGYLRKNKPEEYLFAHDSNSSSQHISLHVDRILKQLHIPRVTFHGFRHSHVSYLLDQGIDIAYISKRVGHASTTMTLTRYAHLLREKSIESEQVTLDVLKTDSSKKIQNK